MFAHVVTECDGCLAVITLVIDRKRKLNDINSALTATMAIFGTMSREKLTESSRLKPGKVLLSNNFKQ